VARAKNAIDGPSSICDHLSMNRRKLLGVWISCLALMVVSGCSGSPPEVPSNVTSVSGRHDHEGKEVELTLDTGQVLACLKTSRSIAIGGAKKCKIEDGDYTVFLNGRETVITIHSATQFIIDHQGFFANECLFPMVFKAAHGKEPPPGGC
jgi:hypothetical protein